MADPLAPFFVGRKRKTDEEPEVDEDEAIHEEMEDYDYGDPDVVEDDGNEDWEEVEENGEGAGGDQNVDEGVDEAEEDEDEEGDKGDEGDRGDEGEEDLGPEDGEECEDDGTFDMRGLAEW